MTLLVLSPLLLEAERAMAGSSEGSCQAKSLEQERATSFTFTDIWGVMVVLALLVPSLKPLMERKKRRLQREQREGFDQVTGSGERTVVTKEGSIENGGRGMSSPLCASDLASAWFSRNLHFSPLTVRLTQQR